MAESSADHCEDSTLLIFGYIRPIQCRLQQIIPTSIITLCFDYFFIEDPYSFTWHITDSSLVEQIKSAQPAQTFIGPKFTLYNLTWYPKLCANRRNTGNAGDVDLFLYLTALSPKITSFQHKTTYTFCEEDICGFNSRPITQEKQYTAGWRKGTLKTTHLQNHNQLTFKISMELFGVFDSNGDDITYKYLTTNNLRGTDDINTMDSVKMKLEELTNKMDAITKRIDDIEWRINEKDKTNDDEENKMNKLMNEVKSIKQTMKTLMYQNIDADQQKLKTWLERNKLLQYFDVFMEHGIEDLMTAALLTEDAIKQMKITKVGHQLKLKQMVTELNQNKSDNNNYKNNNNNDNNGNSEGGTSFIG